MDRRRAGGLPALLRRVRWGNVGRLMALLAAGVLAASAIRGCGPDPPAAAPGAGARLPPERPKPERGAAGPRKRIERRAAARQEPAGPRRPGGQGKGERAKKRGRADPTRRRPAVEPEPQSIQPAPPVESRPAPAPGPPSPPPAASPPPPPPPAGEFAPNPVP